MEENKIKPLEIDEEKDNVELSKVFKFMEINNVEEFKEMTELIAKLSENAGELVREMKNSNADLLTGVAKDLKEFIDRIKGETSLDDNIVQQLEELAESKTPNNTITLVDKITYSLAGGRIPYGETQPLKVEKGRSKKQLTTFVTLDTDVIGDILPDSIKGEDINLLEAIISLVIANEEEGINVFTFNDIYRVEKKNLKVNPNRKIQEELEKRILKLMVTLITIDSSEEKQAYYPDLFYKQTSNLLNADFIEVEVKGNKTKAIRVIDIPVLYKYAKAKKQLTNIPFILTDNQLVKTDAVLKLEKYLCRRIAQMRKSKKLTNIILFSTIYDNMNFNQKSKGAIDNAKAKTRINAEEVLKGLIATKYIKNYQIEAEGRNQYHRLVIEL